MDNEVLLKLLRVGLLSDLGAEDQRLQHVEATAACVAEWFDGDGRPLLASALLRSFDESSMPTNDPSLSHADECLLDQWPLYRNVFPEPPKEILRAIVFQASISVAAANHDLEAAVWYVLRTAEALQVSAGRWAPVVEGEAARISAAVSRRLEDTWLPSSDVGKLRMPPISETEEAIDELSEMRAFAEKLGGALRGQLEAQWAVVNASQLRERLLWWHLAGYSDTLDERYANVESTAASAIAAAIDIRRLSPPVAPIAVEHLLAAAVIANCKGGASITFADMADAWRQIEPDSGTSVDEAGLVVSAISSGNADASVLPVPEALTASEVATLVYRDLQAIDLLNAAGN